MKKLPIHPVSALVGAVGCGLAMQLVSMAPSGARDGGTLIQAESVSPHLVEFLQHMTIEHLPDGQGATVPTLRLTGLNLQIVNGLGATNGYPADPTTIDPLLTATNGTGNIILGYSEAPAGGALRTGSHNFITGTGHEFTSYGGAVFGQNNEIAGAYATVTGGVENVASGDKSTVTGGGSNIASSGGTSINGGFGNRSEGFFSSVTGGTENVATGNFSSVNGGGHNHASGTYAWVGGGKLNEATGQFSSVGGGSNNEAAGSRSAVAGGVFGIASASFSSILGGSFNSVTGDLGTIAGGSNGLVSGASATIGGGFENLADGTYATVSGGQGRVISAMNTSGDTTYDWIGAGLWEDF